MMDDRGSQNAIIHPLSSTFDFSFARAAAPSLFG
jgi:hypothetical protein